MIYKCVGNTCLFFHPMHNEKTMLGDYCSRTLSLMRLNSNRSWSLLSSIFTSYFRERESTAPELSLHFSAEGGKTRFCKSAPLSQGQVPRRSWCCELGSLPRIHPPKRDMQAMWSEGRARGSKGAGWVELSSIFHRAEHSLRPLPGHVHGPTIPLVLPSHQGHQERHWGLASVLLA